MENKNTNKFNYKDVILLILFLIASCFATYMTISFLIHNIANLVVQSNYSLPNHIGFYL